MKKTPIKISTMTSALAAFCRTCKKVRGEAGLRGNSKGFSIIEVMVALGLLAIVIASSAKVIILSMQANKATRTYASVISDVQDIVDTYRGQSYLTLLSQFSSDYSSITNGQTKVSTVTSSKSRSTYTVTLTAMKSSSNSNPENVQVNILAEHRRGALNEADYNFTTLISQSR